MQNMSQTNEHTGVHNGNNATRASVRTADAYEIDLEYGGALFKEVHEEMRMMRLRDTDRYSIADPPQ